METHSLLVHGTDLNDQRIQLAMHRVHVAVVAVLQEEHHQERHYRGSRVDDQLPGIGESKYGAREHPYDDHQARHHECL